MKDFARPRGRLRALTFHARLAYSVFLGFTVTGFALTAWLLDDMVGVRFQRVAEYYAGAESPDPEPESSALGAQGGSGGPVIDLADDAATVGVATAMPQRKLLEVTHFHLFTMPVYLLILSHLFMLSRVSGWFKTSTIALAAAGTALHVAAPWAAAAEGSVASVALYAISGTAMGVSYLVMSVLPLWEMWWPEPAQRLAEAPSPTRSSAAAEKAGLPVA